MDIFQLGFVALASFGSVAAVSFVKNDLTAAQKFVLLVGFAFVYGFVPADLGNVLAERVRDAVAAATAITAANVGLNKFSGK